MEENKIAIAAMILAIDMTTHIKALQLRLQAFDSVFQEIDEVNKMIYISRYNQLLNENKDTFENAKKEIRDYESLLTSS